jgi:hypothetical protein
MNEVAMKWTVEDYDALPPPQQALIDAWLHEHDLKKLLVIAVEQDGDALLIHHAKSETGEDCPFDYEREDIEPFISRRSIPAPPFP